MSFKRSIPAPHRIYFWFKVPVMVIVAVLAYQRWQSISLNAVEAPKLSTTAEIKGKPIRSSAPVEKATNVIQVGLLAPDATVVREPAPGNLEFSPVTFDQLASFTFEVTDSIMTSTNQSGLAEKQIPDRVKAYRGKPIALTGFMLPLRVQDGRVTELLLMRDQSMCCYGKVPKMNEWVAVTMREKGVKPILDEPVTLLGTLEIGEKRENGYLSSIYRMVGEKLGDTPTSVKPTTSVSSSKLP